MVKKTTKTNAKDPKAKEPEDPKGNPVAAEANTKNPEVDSDMVRVQSVMAEEGCSFKEAMAIIAEEDGLAEPFSKEEPMEKPKWQLSALQVEEYATDNDCSTHVATLALLKAAGFLVCPLQERHREWLAVMGMYEGALRRREFTAEQFAELVIREAYAADPTKGGTVFSTGSGQAIDFNPANASWNG